MAVPGVFIIDAIGACLAGLISPEVAVARMLLACASAAQIVAALDPAPSTDPAWAAMRRLALDRAGQLDALAAQVRQTAGNHSAHGNTPAEGVARIAAFFDGAVAYSPEASVAVYSLGDPAILAQATAEIVDWLPWPATPPDVLDLGCGIGRLTAALAPRCRSVLGLDVSAGMVMEARRRHPGLRFEQTDGQTLNWPAQSLDMVLAVDSFPYIVQNGPVTVARHIAGAAQALRPGGALVILNLSYRDDSSLDRADAAAWCAYGFMLSVAGARPFRLWDGAAYVLRRVQCLQPSLKSLSDAG